MVQHGRNVLLAQQRARGISRRAKVHQLDVPLRGQRVQHGGDVDAEVRRRGERDLDQPDVVDLRRDRVHAVGGRADEDAVDGGAAKDAQQGVDGLVGADADKEVGGRQGLGCVGVGGAQVAEELLEVVLVGVGVAVEAAEVEGRAGGSGAGAGTGEGEGGAVGVFVGVQEDVGAVIFVVAGFLVSVVVLAGEGGVDDEKLALLRSDRAPARGCWGGRMFQD